MLRHACGAVYPNSNGLRLITYPHAAMSSRFFVQPKHGGPVFSPSAAQLFLFLLFVCGGCGNRRPSTDQGTNAAVDSVLTSTRGGYPRCAVALSHGR
jgi:hypothetical protein